MCAYVCALLYVCVCVCACVCLCVFTKSITAIKPVEHALVQRFLVAKFLMLQAQCGLWRMPCNFFGDKATLFRGDPYFVRASDGKYIFHSEPCHPGVPSPRDESDVIARGEEEGCSRSCMREAYSRFVSECVQCLAPFPSAVLRREFPMLQAKPGESWTHGDDRASQEIIR
jgi:hypothetical protein